MDPPSYFEATRADPSNGPLPSYEDYLSTRELVLRHNSQDYKYGFTIANGCVDSVKPGSLAAESGLVIGDIIVALNQNVYSGRPDAELNQHLSQLFQEKVTIRLYLQTPAAVTPDAPKTSDIRDYAVEYKAGEFDADYGIKIEGCRIQSVCRGTVGSVAGVQPGGTVVGINGVNVEGTGIENVQRCFASSYEEKVSLKLQVDYTCQGVHRRFFAVPFSLGTYGLCFHESLVYAVQPGSSTERLGVRKGGKVVRVNGKEVHDLTTSLIQHVQSIHDMSADLLLWIDYTEDIPVTSRPGARAAAPSDITYGISSNPPTRTRNRRSSFSNYLLTGHMDRSWGPGGVVGDTEAIALAFWSVISMFCFPPVGLPAVCFAVYAVNSANTEEAQWHLRRAYATNTASAILGTVFIIVMCVLFV